MKCPFENKIPCRLYDGNDDYSEENCQSCIAYHEKIVEDAINKTVVYTRKYGR